MLLAQAAVRPASRGDLHADSGLLGSRHIERVVAGREIDDLWQFDLAIEQDELKRARGGVGVASDAQARQRARSRGARSDKGIEFWLFPVRELVEGTQ